MAACGRVAVCGAGGGDDGRPPALADVDVGGVQAVVGTGGLGGREDVFEMSGTLQLLVVSSVTARHGEYVSEIL